jgi:hypothetical protein
LGFFEKIYALILSKRGLGHILGVFLSTHLVTLSAAERKVIIGSDFIDSKASDNQGCQMVYFQTKNPNLDVF